jgi:hypothetical protein
MSDRHRERNPGLSAREPEGRLLHLRHRPTVLRGTRDRSRGTDANGEHDGSYDVETVRRHYFNFQYEEEDEQIDGWELPEFDPTAQARLTSQLQPELTN